MTGADFPVTVKAFLDTAEQHLRRGDIILTRSPTLTSKLIQWFSGSTFSHAALVFLVPHPEDGFQNTFVLESTQQGVGLANLRHYLSGRRPTHEIAVLRLKGNHFTDDFFKQVRGLMLDHVKAGYDFSRVTRIGLSLLFGLRMGLLGFGKKQRSRPALDPRKARSRLMRWLPPQFICSGFIQYGFVKAALSSGLDPQTVVFHPGLTATSGDALLTVMPEDLANSDKLQWLFVARRGWVYRASDYAQAKRIISGARS